MVPTLYQLVTPNINNKDLRTDIKRLVVSAKEHSKEEGNSKVFRTVPVTETVMTLVRAVPTPLSAEHSYLEEFCLLIDLNVNSSLDDTM